MIAVFPVLQECVFGLRCLQWQWHADVLFNICGDAALLVMFGDGICGVCLDIYRGVEDADLCVGV